MKIPDYIILTPVAPFKLYCFDRFIKNILSFKPRPKEIIFCAEPDADKEVLKWRTKLKNQEIKLKILILEPELIKKFPGSDVRKLTYSREHLRNYFIKSPYDWALWLDCDIIPDSNVAKVLLKIALSEKFLAVANQYLARIMGFPIRGMGCTLTHKTACIFAKFQITQIIWEDKPAGYLADDFWFLTMLQIGNRYVKKLIGWNALKVGRFVTIRHIPERGPEKVLKSEQFNVSNIKKDY